MAWFTLNVYILQAALPNLDCGLGYHKVASTRADADFKDIAKYIEEYIFKISVSTTDDKSLENIHGLIGPR